jgi:hypothetical protein
MRPSRATLMARSAFCRPERKLLERCCRRGGPGFGDLTRVLCKTYGVQLFGDSVPGRPKRASTILALQQSLPSKSRAADKASPCPGAMKGPRHVNQNCCGAHEPQGKPDGAAMVAHCRNEDRAILFFSYSPKLLTESHYAIVIIRNKKLQ